MTASTSGDGIVNPSGAPVLLVGLVYCIIFQILYCFVNHCSFSFGHCFVCSFFGLHLLITSLVSSNFLINKENEV
jgi:hypothetical protein